MFIFWSIFRQWYHHNLILEEMLQYSDRFKLPFVRAWDEDQSRGRFLECVLAVQPQKVTADPKWSFRPRKGLQRTYVLMPHCLQDVPGRRLDPWPGRYEEPAESWHLRGVFRLSPICRGNKPSSRRGKCLNSRQLWA